MYVRFFYFLIGVLCSLYSPLAFALTAYQADVLAHNNAAGSFLNNFWQLADAAGCTSFVDSGSNSNNATVISGIICGQSSIISSESGTSANFNGTTGYATLPSSVGNFEYTQPFTVEFAFNLTSCGSNGSTYFALTKQTSGGSFQGWSVGLSNAFSGCRLIFIAENTGSIGIVAYSNLTVSAGANHLATVYYDGTGVGAGAHFELDGTVDTTPAHITQDNLSGGSILTSTIGSIGVRGGAGSHDSFFGGNLQYVALYTSPTLTSPDILGRGYAVGPNHYALSQSRTPLAAVTGTPVILIDSDMYEDVGDVGATALLAKLAAGGEATILGEINSTSIPTGVVNQRILTNYNGGTAGTYGAYQGNDLSTTSTVGDAQMVTRFGAKYAGGSSDTRSNYTDSTLAYRSMLNSQADGSVTVVLIGNMKPFNLFINSTANCGNCSSGDSINLTGVQLLAKIKRVVIEGGTFYPSGVNGPLYVNGNVCCATGSGQPQYNFSSYSTGSIAQSMMASLASNNVEVVLTGDEQGATVFNGPNSASNPLADPIKYAYNFYNANSTQGLNSSGQRDAWDELAVLFAVRGFGQSNQASPGNYFETWMLRGTMALDVSGDNPFIGPSVGTVSNVAKVMSDANLTKVLSSLSDQICHP